MENILYFFYYEEFCFVLLNLNFFFCKNNMFGVVKWFKKIKNKHSKWGSWGLHDHIWECVTAIIPVVISMAKETKHLASLPNLFGNQYMMTSQGNSLDIKVPKFLQKYCNLEFYCWIQVSFDTLWHQYKYLMVKAMFYLGNMGNYFIFQGETTSYID